MTVFKVEEHDPDAWGGGSGIFQTKYVEADNEHMAVLYCKAIHGNGYWKANKINIEDANNPPVDEHDDRIYVIKGLICKTCGTMGKVARFPLYGSDGQNWYKCLKCKAEWSDLD